MIGARQKDLSANIYRDTLYIEGTKYTVDTLDLLPSELKPEKLTTIEKEGTTFFWSKHSPLSNFNQTFEFTIDEQRYTCIEQYYAHEKSKYFKDEMAAEKILLSRDPLVYKRTPVKNFKPQEWQKVAEKVMRRGLENKLDQNYGFREILKQTGSTTIAEASPHDSIWGIGMGFNHPNITNKQHWGQNSLGKLLQELRDAM
jgi:hypothetical protein